MMNNQTSEPASKSASIDVGDVLKGIWKRKHWLILTTAIAAAGSVLFVMTAKPEYTSEARVVVENLETPFSQTSRQQAARQQVDQQEVRSQVEIAHSRDLAARVINDLKLAGTREFDPLKRGIGPLSRVLMMLGFKSDPALQTPLQRAIAVYDKNLTAYQVPESKVIIISYKSGSAKRAALVANKIAEEFVSLTREVQSSTTGRARNWLAEQIDGLRKKVLASELAVEKFRANAGLLKGRDPNSTLSNQELSELNSQIILAEAQRSEIQARAKAIRKMLGRTGSVASSSEVLNSQLIQRLRERQITLEGRKADLSTTYLPNHPRVRAVQREINGLNRQIRREALKIVSGLEQQAKVATARVSSLRASLNNLKTRASGTNLDQVKLRALEREAKANRTLLETFLTKYSDASTREDKVAQPGKARIISTADVSLEPSFPKPGPTVLLSIVGGFFLSAGLAFMAAVMEAVSAGAGVRSRAIGAVPNAPEPQTATPVTEVARPTSQHVRPANIAPAAPVQQAQPVQPATVYTPQPPVAPPVQATPPGAGVEMTAPSVGHLPVSRTLDDSRMNALAAIQNAASQFTQGLTPAVSWINSNRQTLGIKRLAVVGMPGTEFDTAAICLGIARILAAQGVRAIVIDAAMQGSQLAALTSTNGQAGLGDLITGYASFMDVIVKDDVSTARILRVGQRAEIAWPLLASDRMETILSALDNDENHDIAIVYAGILPPSSVMQNGALAKCQATLMAVGAEQLADAATAIAKLEAGGMRHHQYLRIESDGGTRQSPAGTANQLAGIVQANQASQAQTAAAAQATANWNAPLFSKVS